MAGALAGLRVIDFGQYVAGPLAAMLLADQGADVVRVDPPGGPRLQDAASAVWNRGKRSIVLDLRQPEERALARRLVATADVVIENFRPGVLAGFGLGAREVTAAHPCVIYCSLPGFGADDPRAQLAGWEGIVLAAASAYGFTTGASGAPEPVFSALPIASAYAAFLAVNAIVLAAHARVRDGVGQSIEVPLFDAMFSALGFRAQRVHRPATSELADDVARAMGRAGGRLAGIHRCKDGRWIYVHAGNKNARDFAEAAGAAAFPEGADAREQVRALFETRTAAEWEALGDAVRSEVVEFRSSAEWLKEPHALESGMIVQVDDPTYGRMLQPGLQVRLSGTPGSIARPAVPPGSSRAEILAEVAEERVQEPLPQSLPSDRPVLDGVRVLDLCIVLAGPTCGRTLAEYGADVIKIEMPSRSGAGTLPGRPSFHPFNIDVNRGKRSIVLDLKTPAGLDVFWTLVERADVVVQNFRDGIADRLGIGYEAVRARRPNIVYASLNTYGYAGPWKGRPGHEQLAQAATGMAVRFGGDGPPLLQHVGAINDYGTGLMGAFAVSLALLHRQRTGEGQHVSTSLAQTACILQSPFLFDHVGKEWDEPCGQEARGSGALQQLYATKDGWLFLGGRAEQTSSLESVEGLQGAARDIDPAVFLERRLREEPTSVWVERLARAGLGAHEVARLTRLMDDPWVRARGLIVTLESPELGPIDQVGVTTQMSRTRLRPGRAAPSPGADTRSILDEHGLA